MMIFRNQGTGMFSLTMPTACTIDVEVKAVLETLPYQVHNSFTKQRRIFTLFSCVELPSSMVPSQCIGLVCMIARASCMECLKAWMCTLKQSHLRALTAVSAIRELNVVHGVPNDCLVLRQQCVGKVRENTPHP